jgi:superfamily II DNA or RNA helicase
MAHLDDYLRTGDALYLMMLSKEERKNLVSEVEKKKVKTFLDLKIMNLTQYQVLLPKQNRHSAGAILSRFSVAITGAYPGNNMLTGVQTAVFGMIIKVHGSFIFPSKYHLDVMRAEPDVWRNYINKLGSVGFFSQMTNNERIAWLAVNQDPTDSVFGEHLNQKVEFVQPGRAEFVNKLEDDDREELFAEDNRFTDQEFYDLYRHSVPTKSKIPLLTLNKSFWQLTVDFEYAENGYYDGLVIDTTRGVSQVGYQTADESEKIVLIDNLSIGEGKLGKVGFVILFSDTPLDMKKLKMIAHDLIVFDDRDFDSLVDYFKDWMPSMHKSFIHKIIRYGAFVTVADKEYDSHLALIVSTCVLAMLPGSFVPDIQRFVTGLESVFKRMVVIGGEDSFFMDEESTLSAASCGLIAQRVKKWVPHEKVLRSLLKFALFQLDSEKKYNWKVTQKENTPVCNFSGLNGWKLTSALIDEMKSFSSDLKLMRDIANMYVVDKLEIQTMNHRPPIYNIRNAIDHHCMPNIFYFFERNAHFVQRLQAGSKVYSKMVTYIWEKSSSFNPRRGKPIPEIPRDITQAQDRVKQALYQYEPLEEIPVTGTYEYIYTLSSGWLPAMIGGIEIKQNPVTMVSVHPDSIYNFAAMRRPGRDTKEDDRLSDALIDKAILSAKELLRVGYPMKSAKPPHPNLERSKAILVTEDDEDVWYVEKDGVRKKWEDLRVITTSIPTFRFSEAYNIYKHKSDGIAENAVALILEKLMNVTRVVAQQVIRALSTKSPFYEFPRIGREGGATKEAVSMGDTAVFAVFAKIASMLPAIIFPYKGNPIKFGFRNRTVLWSIMEQVKQGLMGDRRNNAPIFGVEQLYDRREYNMRVHQTDALDDLTNQPGRGNFLWLATGSGKTLVALHFIKHLVSTLNPSYIIYTLPPGALLSVGEEIRSFGFDIDLLIPTKKKDENVPNYMRLIKNTSDVRPGRFIIITHDNLKRAKDSLLEIAPKSVVIFDECHKLLNDTLRTSSALDISRAASHFLCMTGTPVVDNKVYKLLQWFEQIYEEVEIGEDNFWMGATAMVSKLVITDIKTKEHLVLAKLSNAELAAYQKLVPPTMGGKNHYPKMKDFSVATNICYDACTREMVTQTIKYVNEKRGVHLVGRSKTHVLVLKTMLLDMGLMEKDIMVLSTSQDNILLTDESVKKKQTPDYKVVIVPQSKAEGYTVTRLNVQITSVYPSNQATRTQMKGRINRLSQNRKEIDYVTVHTGILTHIMDNHIKAGGLQAALGDLGKAFLL